MGWELQDGALGQHSVPVRGAGRPAADPGLLVLVEPMSVSASHSPDPVPASQADEANSSSPTAPQLTTRPPGRRMGSVPRACPSPRATTQEWHLGIAF